MLEQTGTVVEANDDWLWVETQSRSACSQCGTGSCSTSVIARWFGVKRNRLQLVNSLRAKPGQQVVIGIPDQVLVAVSLRAYLVPILGMLGAAALAGLLNAGEGVQALMAIAGLLIGLTLMGRISGVGNAGARYTPQLLRTLGSPTVEIDNTALTRSRS